MHLPERHGGDNAHVAFDGGTVQVVWPFARAGMALASLTKLVQRILAAHMFSGGGRRHTTHSLACSERLVQG